MDFHGRDSGYASHNFHAFPARFPPQLPRKCIEELTKPGDIVLDPMMGSGTTILEAYLTGRQGIGFDIDPLAIMISRAKVTKIDTMKAVHVCNKILERAELSVREQKDYLENRLKEKWDEKTRKFVDYWFAHDTQVELLALLEQIEKIEEADYRCFFESAFSAIIITKSGGVSLAFDLAHTRPHRARIVIDRMGKIIEGEEFFDCAPERLRFMRKKLRSPFVEFKKRVFRNLKGLSGSKSGSIQPYLTGLLDHEPEKMKPCLVLGNAQKLPLKQGSVDLIVTSPPYASNAIDYMRAHKFSLVWMGYPVDLLGEKRKKCIGGEALTGFQFEHLPGDVEKVIGEVKRRDEKKGRILHRYFSEMKRTLAEMYRVLKHGKAAIVVVGSSVMKGVDTEIQNCLAKIGRDMGFTVPTIGERNIDRDRRMMPSSAKIDLKSQIQKRMHKEYVIAFYKPYIQ